MKHKYRNIDRLFNLVCRSLFYCDNTLGYARTLEALTMLANVLKDTETGEDVWSIGECQETDLASMLIGAYWFCARTETGKSQWSPEYAALGALGRIYEPMAEDGPEPDSCEADVYEALLKLHKKDK